MITLEKVSKSYGKTEVLSGISFTIHPGEFVCITGHSGAGKSTLIHMLIGAETITEGKVNVDGVDLRKVPRRALQLYRRRVGIVFQDYKLLWNRTVAENIAYPLEVCGASDKVIEARVQELLKLMQLEKQANTLCHALSGGEKARTAIARAVVHKPMIILADEPTGNLDPHESLEVLKLFKRIHAAGTSIILASHDTFLVDALKTRVIRLENGKMVRDSVGDYHGKKTKGGKKPKAKAEKKAAPAKKEKATKVKVKSS